MVYRVCYHSTVCAQLFIKQQHQQQQHHQSGLLRFSLCLGDKCCYYPTTGIRRLIHRGKRPKQKPHPHHHKNPMAPQSAKQAKSRRIGPQSPKAAPTTELSSTLNMVRTRTTVPPTITTTTIWTMSKSWVRDYWNFNHFRTIVTPTRFQKPYTLEQLQTVLCFRLPISILIGAIVVVLAPLGLIRIHGPSMLPTMSADESDIWLVWKFIPYWFWYSIGLSHDMIASLRQLRHGDVIGFAPPNAPYRISCKRVVGLPGDVVSRYGSYVHLFLEQDPNHLGLLYPQQLQRNGEDSNNGTVSGVHGDNDDPYHWMDREWDGGKRSTYDPIQEAKRTILVPPHHVWVEADCPGLGIDSRQFGPIPMEWIYGRIVCRVWPLWRNQSRSTKQLSSLRQRPHPIPLDQESLHEFNVYRVAR